MSPELLGHNVEYDAAKVDVWAFGVLFYYLWTRKVPYNGLTQEQTLRQIMDGKLLKIPLDTPQPVTDLLKSCWNTVPAKRPGMEQIIERLDAIRQLDRAGMALSPPLPPRNKRPNSKLVRIFRKKK